MPRVAAIVAAHAGASIRVERAPPGQRLGGLRNIAIARARGEWICQWDDDDRYHPERLRLQWEQAQSEQADVNYLVDQLHWFRADGLLFWDDWGGEPYPMNLIQGTILARRDVMPPYPDIGRGEDTLQTHALLRAEASKAFRVSRLRGMGWCYISDSTEAMLGRGASPRDFRSQAPCPGRLLPRLALLRDRLKDYRPELPPMRTQLGAGAEYVTLGDPTDQTGRPERVRSGGLLLAPDLAARAGVHVARRRPGFGRPDPIVARPVAQSRAGSRDRHDMFASKQIVPGLPRPPLSRTLVSPFEFSARLVETLCAHDRLDFHRPVPAKSETEKPIFARPRIRSVEPPLFLSG